MDKMPLFLYNFNEFCFSLVLEFYKLTVTKLEPTLKGLSPQLKNVFVKNKFYIYVLIKIM